MDTAKMLVSARTITKVTRWRGVLAIASRVLRMRGAASLSMGSPGCCKFLSIPGEVGVGVAVEVLVGIGVTVGVTV